MNTKLQNQQVSTTQLLRWGAEVSGVILFVGWLGFVCGELVKTNEMPAKEAFYGAAALVLIFAGYALLWRHALTGSVLVFLGTVGFFAIGWITTGILPGLDALWFAIPGVLALLAWNFDRRGGDTSP
ncbi:hypothetical protein [Bythopirellula polymerisocia]|uniref:SPW repeat protein n=1 Tax=Bythopirellula polymerisocia TaxID=2528003 RepID=A0A5C6CU80_9BACT|nr:hypothetical protein [Bythopirellula polymerisocia]TWU28130.1 hypothetical protein Pla144_14170 [Bythopirellula polymerisocia]